MALTVYEIWKSYPEKLGKEIDISGWVRTERTSKNFGFIELNDGTFFKNIQVVYDDTLPNFAEVTKITTGSSLTVKGKLIESPGDKQPFELKAENIEIIGLADPEFPLQKKRTHD